MRLEGGSRCKPALADDRMAARRFCHSAQVTGPEKETEESFDPSLSGSGFKTDLSAGMELYAFNPHTREAEAGGAL